MGLLLILLVGVMVLIPPLALARAIQKVYWRPRNSYPISTRLVGTGLGYVPIVVNLVIFISAVPSLITGQLELSRALAIAMLISWVAFWARVVLMRRGAKGTSRYRV